MKPIFIPLYPSSLFLLFVTLLVAGESAPIYSPSDDITLNCGSSGDTVSNYDFQTWTGDINSKFFPEAVGSASQVEQAPPSSSMGSQVPFTTARLSYSEFTYIFPVSPGQKFIRLYFFPATYNVDFDRSKSLFSVKAGGYRLLKDFNASLSSTVYDGYETLLREFCLNFEPDQRSLNITFTPSQGGYAFINGIEIMSMPTNLYHSAAQGDGAIYLGSSDSRYYVENNTALEMIFRINVGGSPVSPNEDTGMYRTWDPIDELYLDDLSRNLSIARRYNTPLNFARIPNYIAPEEVYRTGRTMGGNSTINKSYNLTWGFPVNPDFSYLVRLHFCEIVPNFTAARDRMFQIFIANLTAELHADIIRWTTENGKGNGIPIYRDYFVPVPILGTQKKGFVILSVALQANQDDNQTRYNDAILNGLEIFKLNDTDGNLGGPIPELPNVPPKVTSESSRNSKKKSTPMLAILAGVVSALLVLSFLGFLVFRLGRKVKDSNSSHRTTTSTMTLRSPYPSH
ncbi:putative non-specific serine/threonine protein kinase [Rosa chinensis]|uniref:Putative non-specific serine/threonine protein kinase n=1 Tax=Rosa chinensis TaxID=74649 RepID=A0A2P6PRW7_ROSCH|nr:putative non-specific serine/threonine protein kinase [Rosa chinensis]